MPGASLRREEPILKIAFDIKTMKPGCALIQAAMGGTPGIANHFSADDWEIAPTPGMRVYEVTPEQLTQLIKRVKTDTVQ